VAANPFAANRRRAVAISRPRVASVRSACVGTVKSYLSLYKQTVGM
jgi:hypothetical protein